MPACRRPEREQLEKDYHFMTAAEVAAKYGAATSTIRNWVAHYGIARNRPNRHMSAGDVIGSWTLVEKLGASRFGAMRWRVRCECGKVLVKISGHIWAAEKMKHSCGCKRRTGCGLMSGKYWKSVLQKARDRGIEVLVTPAEVWEQFRRQDGRCALTGLAISFGTGQSASLDRIRSEFAYSADNIQWVHKTINRMKNKLGESEFIEFCRLVWEHSLSSKSELQKSSVPI